MKILVTGASGQLGHDIVCTAKRKKHDVIGSARCGSSLMMDLNNRREVFQCIMDVKPDAIIHCAAWTDVDGAEENEAECRRVNVDGTKNIAEAAKTINSKFLYISTDYVFDGSGTTPWKETNLCRPLNVYGQSKLDGERIVREVVEKHFVVRSSWLYGIHGKNFVKTMLRIGNEHKHVRVVDDQIGTPTYTADLARLIMDIIETEAYGVYHAVNEGEYVSWYRFAKEIFKAAELEVDVIPVSSEQYASKAVRPKNSRLDTGKLKATFVPLPSWEDALARYLKEIKYGANQS